jgi:hypothetical protein
MKVYALLFKSPTRGIVLPHHSAVPINRAVTFFKCDIEGYVEAYPDIWMIYELELDEEELCDT